MKHMTDKPMKTDSEENGEKNSTKSEIYRLTVVCKIGNQFLDRHVDLSMPLKTAEAFSRTVMKRGFMTDGSRIFPDQIESVQLYKIDKDGNKVE